MTTIDAPIQSSRTSKLPLRAGECVDEKTFDEIRTRLMLDYCKWDPQVQDVATIARFPVMIDRSTWTELARAAEDLYEETIAIERALLDRPDLFHRLALSRRLRKLFADERDRITPAASRWMRFDFHFTTDGWQISEVNSDVPGGFCESSALPALVASQVGGNPVGDPAQVWVESIARSLSSRSNKIIALLAAAGFMEDQQVVSFLARKLREIGIDARLAQPAQLRWIDGHAHLGDLKLDAIVRFYQGEWLATLGSKADWRPLFAGGKTPVANPGCAILTESKRLPLTWDELGIPLSAWKKYLPETRDVRDAPWRKDDSWLVKSAYCNTGDTVAFRGGPGDSKHWRKILLNTMLHANHWIVQRRFDVISIDTPIGAMRPCLGVYVIDGHACGIYGRLSRHEIVTYAAIDVPVLIDEESSVTS